MSDGRKYRVLVVEDSAVARHLLVDILSSDPELRVIAEAADGTEAIRDATRYRPDVIVMDVVMPSMGGLEATRRIMEQVPTPVVLVSAYYQAGDASKSSQALESGALTLVEKPGGPHAGNFPADAEALATTVRLMAEVKVIRRRAGSVGARRRPVEIVALAASTGGPTALAIILRGLPAIPPVPILVVQHNTAGFDQVLVDWLDSMTPASVRLARDGDPLRPGEIVIAPSDVHLGVTERGTVALRDEPPIGRHRPSATHLFRSVASVFGATALGVILTGIGEDGVAGLMNLKEAGGLVLAQDEATSVVYGMPGVAAVRGIVDRILPLDQIAGALIAAWNRDKQ